MKKNVLLFPLVLTVFGCASPVPVAENFPVSYQKVARTAAHWDVIAEDVVTQTAATIEATPVLQKRGLFVSRSTRSAAFDVAFRDFLINRMVSRGMPVSVCKLPASTGFAMDGTDVDVQYEARIIRHGADMPQYRPGMITSLAAGIAVMRNIGLSDVSKGEVNASIVALGALTDLGVGHLAEATRTELLITTTIAENNRFILRRSDIYYVPDFDMKLFTQRVNQQSSLCAQDNVPATASKRIPDAADIEASRSELLAHEMKRWNPSWQSAESFDAYAY